VAACPAPPFNATINIIDKQPVLHCQDFCLSLLFMVGAGASWTSDQATQPFSALASAPGVNANSIVGPVVGISKIRIRVIVPGFA
jgi:hypothetical protein